MSSYYTPGKVVIGRHWKRPKPRVYECNIRDAERFYQQTYKDYLQAKDSAASRRYAEDKPRVLDDEGPASRWTIRRSNSLIDDSISLDNLKIGSLSGHLNDNRTSNYSSNSETKRNIGSTKYSLGESKVRATSVYNTRRDSPEGDASNIEQRLARLRKLREELGLPSESGNDTRFTSSTSRISARQTSPSIDIKEKRHQEMDQSSTYSTSRGNSKSYINGNNSFAEKFKYDSDTSTKNSTRLSNKYSFDEDSYSRESKQDRKSVSFAAKDDLSGFKSSASSSRRFKDEDSSYDITPKENSYKSIGLKASKSLSNEEGRYSRSVATNGLGSGEDDEDDALLSSIRKKFLSSDEILERIKKMDDDL